MNPKVRNIYWNMLSKSAGIAFESPIPGKGGISVSTPLSRADSMLLLLIYEVKHG